MKFSEIVLCSDLDGTLLNEKNQISEENLKAIEYFRNNGGKFMIATGRVPEAVRPVIGDITIDFPCICHNGCSVYDLEEEKYIEMTPLDEDAVDAAKKIIEISPKSGVEVMTYKGIYVTKSNHATDRHLKYEKINFFEADGMENAPKPWLKILFAQEEEDTELIKREIAKTVYWDKYNFAKTYKYYYEIFNKNASKGTALEKICKTYGIDLKNVIAIGDNENDISMLSVAGTGVAVENASEHVKVHAKMCAESVADLILKL